MTGQQHIGLQALAIYLITWVVVFFPLVEGLRYTYGDSRWYGLLVIPTIGVAQWAKTRYATRALKNYYRELERRHEW